MRVGNVFREHFVPWESIEAVRARSLLRPWQHWDILESALFAITPEKRIAIEASSILPRKRKLALASELARRAEAYGFRLELEKWLD